MILGLDISTKCTGWAIVDDDGELIKHGAIRVPNTKAINNIFDKAEHIECELKKVFADFESDVNWEIWIEEIATKFTRGKSTAHIICLCARFNGMISLIIKKMLGATPMYVKPNAARRENKLKISRTAGAKASVLQHVVDNYPSFTVRYTKKGNVHYSCYDEADAIVVARAGYLLT